MCQECPRARLTTHLQPTSSCCSELKVFLVSEQVDALCRLCVTKGPLGVCDLLLHGREVVSRTTVRECTIVAVVSFVRSLAQQGQGCIYICLSHAVDFKF